MRRISRKRNKRGNRKKEPEEISQKCERKCKEKEKEITGIGSEKKKENTKIRTIEGGGGCDRKK